MLFAFALICDFNLHIDKKNDLYVNLIKYMAQAFGLHCQVELPALHQYGHTIDTHINPETIG